MPNVLFILTKPSSFLAEDKNNRPLLLYNFVFVFAFQEVGSINVPTFNETMGLIAPNFEGNSLCLRNRNKQSLSNYITMTDFTDEGFISREFEVSICNFFHGFNSDLSDKGSHP